MIRFSKEKVLLLHRIMAQATGGSVGVREEGLLSSALEGAFGGFGDMEFYPTLAEKGARLGYTLIANHAFVDGNKRIGIFIMLTFLAVNGLHISCTNDDIIAIGLGVADGSMSYEALLDWVRAHTEEQQ
jgi:death-on-curing protein